MDLSFFRNLSKELKAKECAEMGLCVVCVCVCVCEKREERKKFEDRYC